MLDKELQLAAT